MFYYAVGKFYYANMRACFLFLNSSLVLCLTEKSYISVVVNLRYRLMEDSDVCKMEDVYLMTVYAKIYLFYDCAYLDRWEIYKLCAYWYYYKILQIAVYPCISHHHLTSN